MAAKCGGLPLALVVMGGLLSQKQLSIAEWEKLSGSMVWQHENEGEKCMRILGRSYADLPYDLKWCFLYFGAFPEDYQIKSDRLIRLWIAEGFIAESVDELTLEETAEIQLEKLIQRSLVHVVDRNPEYGIIGCRVHDLLHELCISEAKQIDFMSLYEGTRNLLPESLRRFSIITEPEETISRLKSAPRLRALLGFNFLSDSATNLSVGGLRLIRVIDLQGASKLEVLPKEIGGLVNLRYLSLQGTGINSLPETIKNLSRLQFLDVRTANFKFLSLSDSMSDNKWKGETLQQVWEIETLRQVFFPYGASLPNRVQCRWRYLQVLRWISSGSSAGNWMDDTLHKVKDIKTLEISEINAYHHEVLSLNLPQFSRLKKLRLHGSSIPWTALTLSGLHLLRTLIFNGPVKRTLLEREGLELDYAWPAGLTYLELVDSHFHRDPLPSLGQLSELRFLTLRGNVYSWGKEMKFHGDEFKQLQELKLARLYPLERMTVEDATPPKSRNILLVDSEDAPPKIGGCI